MARCRHTLITLLLAWPGLAGAGDLAKVDRTLAKEPAYSSGAPRYALLVFGPEAQARVWLVLDGESLYIDRDGNGRLDEDDERLALKGAGDTRRLAEAVPLGVTTGDGKQGYSITTLTLRREGKDGWSIAALAVETQGRFRQRTEDPVPLAGRPRDAAVLHFDGPLAMDLYWVGNGPDGYGALAPGRASGLYARVATAGLGRGTTVAVLHAAGVPEKDHPVAEVEFPHKDKGAKPIRVRFELGHRC
jgi:hypothetical protein